MKCLASSSTVTGKVLDATCCAHVLTPKNPCHFSKPHHRGLQKSVFALAQIAAVRNYNLTMLPTSTKMASTTMPRWRQRQVVNAYLLFRLLHMGKLNADTFCPQISAWSTANKHSFQHTARQGEPLLYKGCINLTSFIKVKRKPPQATLWSPSGTSG